MPVTEAQKKATTKYVKNKYDRHVLTMPKGKKATLQAHAATKGESLNGFVNRAIDGQIERDTGNMPTENIPVMHLTNEEKAHIEKRREVLAQVQALGEAVEWDKKGEETNASS